jgi:hypothetical protein
VHQNAELVYVPWVAGPWLLAHREVHTLHIGHICFAGGEREREKEGGEGGKERKKEVREGNRERVRT